MRESTVLTVGSLIFLVVCVGLFLFSAGKEKVADRSQPPEPPKAEELVPVSEAWGELAFDGPAGKLVDEYKDNRIAADAKYKDKRVRVWMRVEASGRTAADKMAYLGTTHLSASEPNLFAYFSKANEGTVAGLKQGDNTTVEGICRGRFDDGVFRQIKGYEFVVRLARCRIVTP